MKVFSLHAGGGQQSRMRATANFADFDRARAGRFGEHSYSATEITLPTHELMIFQVMT